MLVTVVGWAGVLTGVTGVAIGLIALRAARRSMRECLDVLARRAAVDGPVDSRAVRDVALYRYDALDEMTGRLSFSLAFINGFGDGVVLTSINGRTETRTYARAVRGGKGLQPLSPEEEHAVWAARLGIGPEAEPHRVPR
ncbi:hypothetical protein GCM10010116_26450 [Microbispora rosea subsp. aerata]|nr:DUF4446 family protein [Microbispora rosea]GGO13131.1 hypothetical protein GCM10010116_26450 [Microbispora rosea subsp. aerata]GIH58453.1 hypothetical protein Mro02_53670 [Microbispora rosea subsp. aerata]GLJ85181.1 hypothetical protein GCM10017588_39090 [Microbispora rosea subsp. aerata]